MEPFSFISFQSRKYLIAVSAKFNLWQIIPGGKSKKSLLKKLKYFYKRSKDLQAGRCFGWKIFVKEINQGGWPTTIIVTIICATGPLIYVSWDIVVCNFIEQLLIYLTVWTDLSKQNNWFEYWSDRIYTNKNKAIRELTAKIHTVRASNNGVFSQLLQSNCYALQCPVSGDFHQCWLDLSRPVS